jgi:hypothetical protein
MNKLTFYEQVGIVIPGSVFLLGLILLLPDLRSIFAKDDISVGGLGLFVLVAYAAGHLIAAVGNVIEAVLWKCFGGMPSDWVTRASSSLVSGEQLELISERLRTRTGLIVPSIKECSPRRWRPIFGQLYRDVLANNPGRIETFNGNYGLNRGLSAAAAALAVATIIVTPERWAIATAWLVVSAIFLYRAYRFGVHFAREVYYCFLALSPSSTVSKSGG